MSAKTREGIPELLLYVAGLAQRFLEKRLSIEEGKGGRANILEVREEKGLGKTLDIILYDGTIAEGDYLVFASPESAIESKVKAILRPKPLDEMRDPREKFSAVKSATAAVGLKIACEDADKAVAGSSVYVISSSNPTSVQSEIDSAKEALLKEIKELVVSTQQEGVILKADAFGSLEALEKLLGQERIVIRASGIGPISKKEVLEAASVRARKKELGVVFSFNLSLDPDVEAAAKENRVKIFSSDIIYTLVDGYGQWLEELKSEAKREAFAELVMPARVLVMQGCCFRVSNPAIFGVEVEAGTIKKSYPLMTGEGVEVGEVRGIQKDKEAVESIKRGEQAAISIMGIYFGRQVKEKMLLYTVVPESDLKLLESKYKQALSEDEREVLEQIKRIRPGKPGAGK